jgi:hypothetical protein
MFFKPRHRLLLGGLGKPVLPENLVFFYACGMYFLVTHVSGCFMIGCRVNHGVRYFLQMALVLFAHGYCHVTI